MTNADKIRQMSDEELAEWLEACIDHNVAYLTENFLRNSTDILNNNDQDNLYRIHALGTIEGILILANALKEVLRQ